MIIRFIKNFKNKQNKKSKTLDLLYNNSTSKFDKGWIKQEINMINKKWKNKNEIIKNIRNPPGKDLAHEYGRELSRLWL